MMLKYCKRDAGITLENTGSQIVLIVNCQIESIMNDYTIVYKHETT